MTLTGEEQHSAALTTAGVHEAIVKAQRCLLGLQRPSGEWCGELEGDSILESEFILLMESIGRTRDPLTLKVAAYLRKQQTPDGGWSIYPGAPNDVSATVKAYFALKLMGDRPDEPHMQRARERALELGGAPAANSFTKIYLALFGQYDWEHVPAIPPEIMLLPRSFFFNIYSMSSWSRTILVPLSIIWSYRPRFSVRPECEIDELFPGGREGCRRRLQAHTPFPSWRHFFLFIDAGLKFLDSLPVKPWRKRSLAAAERWMLDRFKKSAGLGAIFPPIVNSIWALHCRGYSLESPEVKSQLDELYNLVIEEKEDARIQPCASPVWDTALACIALDETGLPLNHPSYEAAIQWLEEMEIREEGDWSVARRNLEPGGWCFEYANEYYPDIDDTAMALIALARVAPGRDAMIRRALTWTLGMQCRNGGWASFDADNDRELLCEFPFADHNAMIDPPTADITGRVLEMLAAYGYNERSGSVKSAIDFLRREQEPDGSWFGRWGVNYIYGTWQVLKGLSAIGVSQEDPCIVRGAHWLASVQNPDGGWGETCESYHDPGLRGRGPSTASQTAWAIMGLIAAGGVKSQAVRRGVEYLLGTQRPAGDWSEEHFTGTGFPEVFYLKYHLYPLYFPLFALGMFARAAVPGFAAAPVSH
ncbi:MAG TPA: squalene--hopene cyclase [Armatimonadota bacterium]|nr:squalene--hopene cyclase [Armatimonadota bacterium]